MRTQVFFRNVASIQEVKPDGSNLFPNVAVAEGQTPQEQLANALQTLVDVPEIDSVVMLPGEGTETLVLPLDSLRRLSFGKRIKIDTTSAEILTDPQWIERDVERYLGTRLAQLQFQLEQPYRSINLAQGQERFNPYLSEMEYGHVKLRFGDMDLKDSFEHDIAALTKFYTVQAANIAQITNARLVKSSLSYSPVYGSCTGDGYINCHIDDEPSFDARIVHVSQGSGTVLFNSGDFEIQTGERNNKTVYYPRLIHDDITCLTIPTGASAVLREPSAGMLEKGRMPSIHSHGIGREDGEPEERLVERYDLELF